MTLAFTVVTVLFAFTYWGLSTYYPEHGLQMVGTMPAPVSFWVALYYSIVTEATVGAGEIQPTGVSRLVVCLNVIAGLAMGGIIVAKLTSIKGLQLRSIAHRVAGDWIEVCRLQGKDLFAFITMYAAKDTLRYDGESYDGDGSPTGFFRAELTFIDNNILKFSYTNRDSNEAMFSDGMATLRFVSAEPRPGKPGIWSRYQATALDFGTKEPIIYGGVRATPEEIDAFHAVDHSRRIEVIKKHLGAFGRQGRRETRR